MLTLGDRIEREDERRFVGRQSELALLEDLIEGRLPYRVVLVHGPGGIGKSTLLRQMRRLAGQRGWLTRLLDGRENLLTSADVERLVAAGDEPPDTPGTPDTKTADDRGLLLLIDCYERLIPLGHHLRTELLPALPEHSLVVIAGRTEPEAAWSQGGWERVSVTVRLRPVSLSEGRDLLARDGIDDDGLAHGLLAWAEGSPLALSVGADALRASGRWGARQLEEDPQMADLLVRRLTEGELDSSHADTATVASIARRTDARLLADVLPGVDAPAALEWLASRSFAQELAGGIALHELVRDALHAQVRRLRPERERELRRRIVESLYGRARAGEVGLIGDLADLVENESLRWALGGEGVAGLHADDARAEDVANLAHSQDQAALAGASEWLAATVSLIREAPRCALVARDESGTVCGLCVSATPRGAPAAAHDDPVLGPWLEHAARHEPDGNVIVWRDSLDFTEHHGRRSSRVLAVMNSAALVRSGLANPRFAYLPIDPNNAAAVEFARNVGAQRIDGLDVRLDERVHECHLLDYGPGGLLAAHRATVYAELGLRPPKPGAGARAAAAPAEPLTPEAVRDALRNVDRPLELARSPLASGRTPAQRAESVRRLLAEACKASFGADPEERLLQDLMRLRYLSEPTTHETVADQLHVSRSTYFRHLRTVTERVTDYVLAVKGEDRAVTAPPAPA